MLIDNLDAIPESFKSGVRGIMLLHRNKDGSIETGNSQRKSFKKISRDADEWTQIVTSFRSQQQCGNPDYRIYASVNQRDITKAIHVFKQRQLDNDYGNMWEMHWFYIDIQNRFFSCLMNPQCRAENNFLIDCDTDEEYKHAILQLPTEYILMDYPTRNGRHIITLPFNPNERTIPVKKDEMMLIG